MMDALAPFLLPVIAPVVGSAVVTAVFAAIARARSGAPPIAGAVVALVSLLCGVIALEGVPSPWPVEAADHALPLGVVGLFIAVVGARATRHPLWLTALLLAGTAAWLRWILAPVIAYTWSPQVAALWMIALTLTLAGVWSVTTVRAQRLPAPSVVGVLALTTGLSAVALAATGSMKYGQLAGALASGLAVFAIAGLRWPGPFPGRTATTVVIPVLHLLLLSGVIFSKTPLLGALVLALSPLAMLAGRNDTSGFPWRGALTAVVVAGIGVALTVGLMPPPPDPSSYGQY